MAMLTAEMVPILLIVPILPLLVMAEVLAEIMPPVRLLIRSMVPLLLMALMAPAEIEPVLLMVPMLPLVRMAVKLAEMVPLLLIVLMLPALMMAPV